MSVMTMVSIQSQTHVKKKEKEKRSNKLSTGWKVLVFHIIIVRCDWSGLHVFVVLGK